MENLGWIKLHRKTKESFVYKNPEAFLLWCHILLSVNHQEKTFLHGNQKITLRPGQILTGRKTLSVDTGIQESKVKRLLDMLESEHQIEQQKTNKYSIITVLRWGEYQESEQQNEQQMNNKRTTDEQQMNTNKNDKNEKNVKNDIKKDISLSAKKIPSSLDEVKTYGQELGLPPEQAEGFYDYFTSNGWKVGGKTPMKDWRAALRNWQRNARPTQAPAPAPQAGQPAATPAPTSTQRPTKRQMLAYAIQQDIATGQALYKVDFTRFVDYQEQNGWPGDWRRKLSEWYARCMESQNNPARRFLTRYQTDNGRHGFREFAGPGTGQVVIHDIYGIRLPVALSELEAV